jgi:hypothetical protein
MGDSRGPSHLPDLINHYCHTLRRHPSDKTAAIKQTWNQLPQWIIQCSHLQRISIRQNCNHWTNTEPDATMTEIMATPWEDIHQTKLQPLSKLGSSCYNGVNCHTLRGYSSEQITTTEQASNQLLQWLNHWLNFVRIFIRAKCNH